MGCFGYWAERVVPGPVLILLSFSISISIFRKHFQMNSNVFEFKPFLDFYKVKIVHIWLQNNIVHFKNNLVLWSFRINKVFTHCLIKTKK